MKVVIAVSGKKRTGKDTFYEIAQTYTGLPKGKRISFADPGKKEVMEYILKPNGLGGIDVEAEKEHLRSLYLAYMTDFKKHYFGNDVWARRALQQIAEENVPYEKLALYYNTDLRFRVEKDALQSSSIPKDWFVFGVRIERPGIEVLDHFSEKELDADTDWFRVIYNDGDLEKYKKSVYQVLDDIVRRLTLVNVL